MDKRIQIWNVLHDGEITAFEQDHETLTMFISIPYLRRRIRPLGDSFVLTLSGLTQVDFLDFDGSRSSLEEALDIGLPEILSTESEAMPLSIDTTLGKLILDFQEISFALDTGQPVTYDVIEKVCEEYWAELKAKTDPSN